MVPPVAKTSRMRQRKLNLKQPLQVVREDDLESFEANEPTLKEISSGIEAGEEQEFHLQAVISAAQAAAAGGSAAKASIPTRGTDAANLPYDAYYKLKFAKPATYIRFSSTVEDCIDGAPYDLVDEDEEFRNTLNEKLRAQAQQASSRPTSRSAAAANESAPQSCSQEQLETDMAAFEHAARIAAPFSNSVSGDQAAPILSLEEQLAQISERLPEENGNATSASRSHSLLRALASYIYPHWQARRGQNGNTPLTPTLKVKLLDTGDALDDSDPYVCFRRREVRAVRKTRGRDAQSSEKLRMLRRQLDDARNLVQAVLTREKQRKDVLATGRTLFEARSQLRGVKRSLPSQYLDGDEDLLIDENPKRRPQPNPAPTPSDQPARPSVPHSHATGPELQLLDEWHDARKRQQLAEITTKVHQHKQWNAGYVDDTMTPIKRPPPDDGTVRGFRVARTEYLPTPPASSTSEHSPTRLEHLDESHDHMQVDEPFKQGGMTASPPEECASGQTTSGPTTGMNTPATSTEEVAKINEIATAANSKSLPVRVRYASPSSPMGNSTGRSPSFRRRIGRGGRVWLDRRRLPPREDRTDSDDEGLSDATSMQDRFKFDHDSDDDADDDPSHIHKEEVDPFEWQSMFLRAQNCPINASAGGHNAMLAQHHAQMQKQRQLQMQAHAQAQSQPQGYASVPGQGPTNQNPQTVRQQVAAIRQQQEMAQAKAAQQAAQSSK